MQMIEEVIRECIKGNAKYQKMLYEKYKDKMYGLCLRYSKDNDHAKDLLQEGFISVFLSIKKFKFKSSIETWMTRLFINTCINENLKLKQVEPMGINVEQIADEGFDFKLQKELDYETVIKCLQKMPESYRIAINLFYFDNLNHSEISKILNISINNSRIKLSRAKNYLKKLLIEN